MANKPKIVLFCIMTIRHYLAFGHVVEQNGLFVWRFVWFLVNAQVAFGFIFCYLNTCVPLARIAISLRKQEVRSLGTVRHTLLLRSHNAPLLLSFHI